MRIEYKFWYIKENDDGFVEEVAVRFNEGDYVTETVAVGSPMERVVTRFNRTKRLDTNDIKWLKKGTRMTDINGNPVFLFKKVDFGNVNTTKEQLIGFLNGEIAKDTLREAINEQK